MHRGAQTNVQRKLYHILLIRANHLHTYFHIIHIFVYLRIIFHQFAGKPQSLLYDGCFRRMRDHAVTKARLLA